MARRALEVGSIVAGAAAEGLPTAFVTLTARHHRKLPLAVTWDAVGKGWSRATSGRDWQAHREDFGLVGYVRVQEVTYGQNGWHPHVHSLLLGEGLGDSANLDDMVTGMHARWVRGVTSQGLEAPLLKGSDWQLVGGDLSGTKLGEYLTKGAGAAGALGMELTHTQSKIARASNSTHSVWKLLDDAINGEVAGLDLWWEWERASKGRRQIAYSRGLRERFGLLTEQTDTEIAAEELGSKDDTVVVLTATGWATLVTQPSLIPQVLTVAETTGAAGLSRFLDGHNVEHWKV